MEHPTKFKRLVICCDGTSNDSIGTSEPPTNVTRLSRYVEGVSSRDQVQQIVYYNSGVGTGTSSIGNTYDSATGRGISSNIRNIYSFICHNYNFVDGEDEIYLVGFSRGAFTAHCVAELINDIGLLKKSGLSHLYELYERWKFQSPGKLSNAGAGRDVNHWILHVPSELGAYVEKLAEKALLKRDVKITACALWDTVSAMELGTPELQWLDGVFPDNIQFGFHALALDEKRKAFTPLLWQLPTNPTTKIRQCWFIGSHSDIGGGYDDAGLANITLIWMVSQLQHYTSLSFDTDGMIKSMVDNRLSFKENEVCIKINGNMAPFNIIALSERVRRKIVIGKAIDSRQGFWKVSQHRSRRPGCHASLLPHIRGSSEYDKLVATTLKYFRENPLVIKNHNIHSNATIEIVSKDTDTIRPVVLQVAQETVHFTVRVMMAKSFHDCHQKSALRKHRNIVSPAQSVVWEAPETKKGKQGKDLEEAQVLDEEAKLLFNWVTKMCEHHMAQQTPTVSDPPISDALGVREGNDVDQRVSITEGGLVRRDDGLERELLCCFLKSNLAEVRTLNSRYNND